MKSLNLGTLLIGAAIVGIGSALVVTNPNQAAYNEYATQRLTAYLQENACTQAPDVLGDVLQAQCSELLDRNQTQISQFVAQNTQRQNFGLFSLYQTDLAITNLLPAYHFETVGVMQQFFTYKAEQR